MKQLTLLISLLLATQALAEAHFVPARPKQSSDYQIDSKALCATAKETLAYLNKGYHYDPAVIHGGRVFQLPLKQVKASLVFICQHQNQLNNAAFLQKHFDFYKWIPDADGLNKIKNHSQLVAHLPKNQILMTKYYVHKAKASYSPSQTMPFALYAIPRDEASLSFEEAEAKKNLTRFKYGKQAILKGALKKEKVEPLAYLSREDLEDSLLQGTVVAQFNDKSVVFNVHRSNNIAYDKTKTPYSQERYWYFKKVDGIKGYGKDAEDKITVSPKATFAADLTQLGLGKLLMVQYHEKGKIITRAGVLADTGGAFQNNLYQVDFLTGSYAGKEAFYRANHHLPDYVDAYFMVLKTK